jgi:hypothetical protein
MLRSLTPGGLVALVREEGPMSRGTMAGAFCTSHQGRQFLDVLEPLLLRGLLLERKWTVECKRCGGTGNSPLAVTGSRSTPCHPCDGTGSVKERVIGLPCTECAGTKLIRDVSLGGIASRRAGGSALVRCPCSSTLTPGLDPSSDYA